MIKFKAHLQVKFIDTLPKTLTGKVDKKELRKLIDESLKEK
jgi:non-ribosomal peptide synthetase component E (peptide arylation enzyme)